VTVKDPMSKDTLEGQSRVAPHIAAVRIGEGAELKRNRAARSIVRTKSVADDYSFVQRCESLTETKRAEQLRSS